MSDVCFLNSTSWVMPQLSTQVSFESCTVPDKVILCRHFNRQSQHNSLWSTLRCWDTEIFRCKKLNHKQPLASKEVVFVKRYLWAEDFSGCLRSVHWFLACSVQSQPLEHTPWSWRSSIWWSKPHNREVDEQPAGRILCCSSTPLSNISRS